MKYRTPAAFRTALEQRLKDRSQEHGTSLVRLRKAVIFDRVLGRLLATDPEKWVLKGALALDFRLGEVTRSTKDIDLIHKESLAAAEDALIAAQRVRLDDYFEISIEKVAALGEEAGGAVRYRARAELAGRLFDEVLIDIGVTEDLIDDPETIEGSRLLAFADLPTLLVPTLSLEQHIAEKVHAYTRTYGDRSSSRVKDLVDLVLISQHASPRAARMKKALMSVFQRRGKQALPQLLPSPPSGWSAPYRKLAKEVGIEGDLTQAHHDAGLMIDPVLSGDASGRWDSDKEVWE